LLTLYTAFHSMSPEEKFIPLVHKLPSLDKLLIDLLESLEPKEWNNQTVAKLWTVKDVVAHLLDGNIRILSGLRDNHTGETVDIKSYQDLVDFLNRLNADWVKAMKRVSPTMLISLLKITGPQYCQYYASLDPHAPAKYSVAWAGEVESKNWMHIAREYTEKFLHQQQIRDAVGRSGLMTTEWFHPFLDVCMMALPHTLRNTTGKPESKVKITVMGDGGGDWIVSFDDSKWRFVQDDDDRLTTSITIHGIDAWKMFSKSIRPESILDRIQIQGDKELARVALSMVSFMA
jgi:uncharacterized protein (TIGR03083 family)